jgi:hypothetical protein
MTANAVPTPESQIHAAALAKGFADASIVEHTAHGHNDSLKKGTWFVLSVKRNLSDDWDVLGMRRTVLELLAVLHNERYGAN